jgi:hypothetical protein
MRPLPLLLLAAACAGDEATGDPTPIEEHACVHIVEGDILDVSPTRDDAPEITVGREPYRVNLLQGAPGFLRFTSDGAPLVLITDFAGAAPAVWTGETREELPAGSPDPFCDEDLPSVQDVDLPAGDHVLELGPVFQANVWLMLGS